MEEEFTKMTGEEAIKHIAEFYEIDSQYAIAKSLSGDGVKVQPIQIKNYLNGKKMSKKVAKRFMLVYGIDISDVHSTGIFSK